MEDKQKLMVIITGAVSAYLQMEQSLPAAAPKTHQVKPRSTMSRWKILGRRKLSMADRMIRNRFLR